MSLSVQMPWKPSLMGCYNFTEKQAALEVGLEEVLPLSDCMPSVFESENWKLRCKGILGITAIKKPLSGPKNNYAYLTLKTVLEYVPSDAVIFFVGLEGALQSASSFPHAVLALNGGVKSFF